ncbi:MAG: sulfite exporter TauE/SafE family protein [Burkholderiales bacterium]
MAGEFAAAFLVGLFGGVHCAGMCGGIVSAFSLNSRVAALPQQLGFNSGRIFSYMVAGAAAGMLGGVGLLVNRVLPAQTALYLVANLMLVLFGAHLAGWTGAVLRVEAAGAVMWRALQPVGLKLMPAKGSARTVAMGMLWGWVPCGMVYSVLALALASGSAAGGALVMLAFGLGTLPNLLAAGLAAQRIGTWRRTPWIRTLAGCIIIALGIAGLARIPGLSSTIRAGLLCLT